MAIADWLEAVRAWTAGPKRDARRGRRAGARGEILESRELLDASGAFAGFANGIALPNSEYKFVTLGDLDNDGDLDALVTRSDGGGLSVRLSDGAGNFASGSQFFGGGSVEQATLGDIDGDGDLDVMVARSDHSYATVNRNEVWTNNGVGVFSKGQVLDSGNSGVIGLADLDSDGDLDAFVVKNTNSPHEVWLNDGAGWFVDSGQRLSNEFRSNYDVALGDVDGDGDVDAFVAGGSNGVWLNDGEANFTRGTQSFSACTVALGDIDADGDLDVLLGSYDGNGTKAWLNNGAGQFSPTQRPSGSLIAYGVALGDLDGDGDLDVFSANDEMNRAFLNDGTGILADSGQALLNSGSNGNGGNRDVALGDIDGDGDIDAFVANPSGSQVFFNLSAPPKVTLPTGGGNFEVVRSGDDLVVRRAGGAEIFRKPLVAITTLRVFGSSSNDRVDASAITGIALLLNGGDGNDTLIGGALADSVNGGNGDDSLIGNGSADQLNGGAGNDWLGGNIGNDRLDGGDDQDTLSGGAGQDELFGGSGNDQLNGGSGNDRLHGEAGSDVLRGDAGHDRLDGGSEADTLVGDDGNDSLLGGDGDDLLRGVAGRDTLDGGSGHDDLRGGADNDSIRGGSGNDTLNGNIGHDTLIQN